MVGVYVINGIAEILEPKHSLFMTKPLKDFLLRNRMEDIFDLHTL